METSATSRAAALVRRARRRAFVHGAARSLFRGASVSAFLAAAAIGVLRKSGLGPDTWSLAALVPGAIVFLLGLVRSRPAVRAAALLLDCASATKERFTAASEARDPEVRELAAEQAIRSPVLTGGRFPVRFPPSGEGLVAALSVFLLVGVVLLVPRIPGGKAGATAAVHVPGRGRGSSTAGDPDRPSGVSAPVPAGGVAKVPPSVTRVERTIRAGEDLTEEQWEELKRKGVARRVRQTIEAALDRGDREGALEALRAAVARAGAVRDPTPGTGPTRPVPARWEDYRPAEAAPGWSPRYDRVVRAYFERTR